MKWAILLVATLRLSAQTGTPSPTQRVATAPMNCTCATSAASPDEVRLHTDWPWLGRYQQANRVLGDPKPGERRVVFLGDSITENWFRSADKYFAGKPYIGRGISGQTTPQMLVRFQQDVVSLKPSVVVINGGTNDIAENTGPSTLEMIENNLQSMNEIAQANGIRVVLAAVTPVYEYPWRKQIQPAEEIATLNAWMRAYCQAHACVYADYFTPMSDEKHAMRAGLSSDGVHPNDAGYAIMAPIAERAIAQALGGAQAQR